MIVEGLTEEERERGKVRQVRKMIAQVRESKVSKEDIVRMTKIVRDQMEKSKIQRYFKSEFDTAITEMYLELVINDIQNSDIKEISKYSSHLLARLKDLLSKNSPYVKFAFKLIVSILHETL